MKGKKIVRLSRTETPKTTTPKRRKAISNRKREPDQELINTIDRMNDSAKKQMEELLPECPGCHKSDFRERRSRTTFYVGTKPVYVCRNCGRSFTIDDDRFQNALLKMRGWRNIAMFGDQGAIEARKLIQKYGINTNNMEILAYINKEMGIKAH